MCELIRYISRFSLWMLSAAVLLLIGLAVALLAVPHLLLQVLYYGVISLCVAAALTISFALLRAAWRKE